MLDDHCMKKINQIIKGKIPLPQTDISNLNKSPQSIPKSSVEEPPQNISSKQSAEEEKFLINMCAPMVLLGMQIPDCENLSPVAKKQVQVEAQKLKEKEVN